MTGLEPLASILVATALTSRRGGIPLVLAGALLALTANLPWAAEEVALLRRIDPSWIALARTPLVALGLNLTAFALILTGVIRMVTVRDPALKLAHRLARRGDAAGAAAMFAQAGQRRRALDLYRRARAWRDAAHVALELGREREAADLLHKAGGHHLQEAARLYRRSGDQATAQRCDQELARWHAGRGQLDAAIEAWLRGGEPLRAAKVAHAALRERRLQPSHPAFGAARRAAEATRDFALMAQLAEQSGRWVEAAQAWRAAGDSARAAESFRRAGKLDEAAREQTAAGRPRESVQLRLQHLRRMREQLDALPARGPGGNGDAEQLERAITREAEVLVPALAELGMEDGAVETLRLAGRVDEAVSRLVAAGQPEAAAELARESLRWDLASPILERLGRWAEASDVAELAGDLPAAARNAEQAGEDDRALQIYRRIGRTDAAARCLAHLGRLEEALVELHRAGMLDEACRLLRDQPGPIPDIPDVVLDMAEHLRGRGDRDQAVACLQRAVLGVALRPGRLAPAIALSRHLLEDGEVDGALVQVRRVLEIDYGYTPARELHHAIVAARSPSSLHDTQAAATPDQRPATPPTQAEERYAILNELGRGGMGVVYRAVDARLERDVAIKVLRTTSPEEAARLEQEAKAAATLNHPGIVTVYDFETGFGGYFIVMEYVPGDALDRLLRTDPARIRRSLGPLLFRLADAVAYAHARHVIHRDLKPGNILLTPEGKVKVLDFGIAARLKAGTGAHPGVCGTPFYMAPEQIRGESPSPASDVYAFGATAFHLATGRPPFPKGNVIDAHLHQPPPDPTEINPDLDQELATMILRCLAKAPAERYPSMASVRDALRPAALRTLRDHG